MCKILINPGTGQIGEVCTEAQAAENIKHLLTDVNPEHNIVVFRRADADYDKLYTGDGRFAFVLCDYDNGRFVEVQMPGVPLNEVRYIDNSSGSIFDFPRLYIDDSSWIWCIAVSILKEKFAKERDE